MKSICNLPLLLSLIVFGVYGQIPIPRREVGFVYGSAKRDAPIHLDFYIDLICPDSQLAFPTMLKIADFYGPEVLVLNTHLFPLPYHRNGFYAAKVCISVQKPEVYFALSFSVVLLIYSDVIFAIFFHYRIRYTEKKSKVNPFN